MAVPTSYTESTFKLFLYRQVSSEMATYTGWQSSNDPAFDEILNDTLYLLNVSEISSLDTSANVRKLRAVGRVYLWRTVYSFLITKFDVTVEGSAFRLNQMLKAVLQMLGIAENEAAQLGIDLPAFTSVQMPAATVQGVVYTNDPYSTGSSLYGVPLDE